MTLEDLLNTLIKRGWKPFGWKDIKRANNEGWFVCFVHKSKKRHWISNVSHRELCAKESGLWQFVCENKLTIVKHPNKNKYPRDKLEREEHRDWTREQGYYGEPVKQNKWYNWDTAEYRLIESALCDEDELEQFLLDKIKIGNEN